MKIFITLYILIFSTHFFAQQDPILIPYRKGNLWGYADTTGRIIITPEYDKLEFFLDGQAQVSKNDKLGFINIKGEVVVPLVYDYFGERRLFPNIGESGTSTYMCIKNHKEGLIIKDKLVIEAEYDNLSLNPYKNSIFIINKKNDKVGVYHYVNEKLSILIPSVYTKIEDRYSYSPENLLFECTKANSEIIFYDVNGKIVKPEKKQNKTVQTKTTNTKDTYENVEIQEGTEVVNIKSEKIPNINEVKFSKNSKPIRFYTSHNGKKGLITISPKIDDKGNITANYDTIPPVYDDIDTNLKDKDLLFVKQGLNHGMLDKKGNVVLDVVYSRLDKFVLWDKNYSGTNYLILDRNGKRGLVELKQLVENNTISYKNTVKIPFEYDGIYTDYYEFFILQQGSKSGVYDVHREKIVVPINYTYLTISSESLKNYKLFTTKKYIPGTVFIGQNGVEFFSE